MDFRSVRRAFARLRHCTAVLGTGVTLCGVSGGGVPSLVSAQAVMLRIRPHLGDTLRMKMEQRIEMSGDSAGDVSKGGPMSAVMCIYTHAVVERVGRGRAPTVMVSITDSVTVMPSAAATVPLFAQTKRALEGKTVRLHVDQDGAITVGGGVNGGVTQRLPAMLPDSPVSAGDVWTRDLVIPVSATHEGTGSVRAKFRLDSLGPDGTVAYLSMSGTFSHKHRGAGRGKQLDETTGTIEGTMQIDRRLEWMTDSRTIVMLLSTVQQEPAKAARVRTKITQSMRAMPRR